MFSSGPDTVHIPSNLHYYHIIFNLWGRNGTVTSPPLPSIVCSVIKLEICLSAMLLFEVQLHYHHVFSLLSCNIKGTEVFALKIQNLLKSVMLHII